MPKKNRARSREPQTNRSRVKRQEPLADYYARLLKTQPKPISEVTWRLIWETERGKR
jgi:hypothetical protein